MTATAPAPAAVAAPPAAAADSSVVRWLDTISRADIPSVGGKAANLGEILSAGLPAPPGFVLSVDAYRRFRDASGIGDALAAQLGRVDVEDPQALQELSSTLRQMIERAPMPPDLEQEIVAAYDELSRQRKAPEAAVAVRSSATAEDNVQFSFAGMFESFLNVRGHAELLQRVKSCWASTFHARVLFYRLKQGMAAEMPVAVIVQAMVNSDRAGVMFTVDPATHDRQRIVIEAAWGLGESVVLGQVIPDRYVIDKRSRAVVEEVVGTKQFMLVRDPRTGATMRVELANDPRRRQRVLTDRDLDTLATLAQRIEEHYGAPQDAEFAIEGDVVSLTQSRPVTTLVQAEPGATPAAPTAAPLVKGLGASPGLVSGRVRILATADRVGSLEKGEVLVTHMTSPDWVPLMRRAAAVVTDAGGMTSHAAIVSRELGIPCVVGTRDATSTLANGMMVTVDGVRGTVTAGEAPAPSAQPAPAAAVAGTTMRPSVITATRLYVNLGEPEMAETVAQRDVDGVGLLRAEFMLLSALDKVHPRALIAAGRGNEIAERLAEKLRVFGRAFAPRPVIYRAIDFRSNEFRGLVGGEQHEPVEENPMLGYRGCYRYIKEPDLFGLELRAIADVRREYPNVHLMIPFVRTAWEFRACRTLIAESALGSDRGLMLWVMAEVPSVLYWLPEYVRAGIAGISIGSNDLTQLVLGVDRDSDAVSPLFDERDGAVLHMIESLIRESRRLGITSSICGQAPSVYPEYAEHLVRWGIDSISVNPDVIDLTRRNIYAAEQRLLLDHARAASDGDASAHNGRAAAAAG